jgi:hypothetical protein
VNLHPRGHECNRCEFNVPKVLHHNAEDTNCLNEVRKTACSIKPLLSISEEEWDQEVGEAESCRDDVNKRDLHDISKELLRIECDLRSGRKSCTVRSIAPAKYAMPRARRGDALRRRAMIMYSI